MLEWLFGPRSRSGYVAYLAGHLRSQYPWVTEGAISTLLDQFVAGCARPHINDEIVEMLAWSEFEQWGRKRLSRLKP
jgi:hypothetical protein